MGKRGLASFFLTVEIDCFYKRVWSMIQHQKQKKDAKIMSLVYTYPLPENFPLPYAQGPVAAPQPIAHDPAASFSFKAILTLISNLKRNPSLARVYYWRALDDGDVGMMRICQIALHQYKCAVHPPK